MQIIRCLTFLVFATAVPLAHADLELDKYEQSIVQRVSAHLPAALADLETAVNINSGTMNFAGVKKVGDHYSKQFEALGFNTTWVDGAEFNRAGHLVALRLSALPNAPKLLLIGHLDTVFPEDDEFQRFRRIDDKRIAGPGITDMKGGNSVMLLALRALEDTGLLDQLSVIAVLTGDEEASGKPLTNSKAALIDAARWADIALGFEDGDGNIRTAVIARRGSVNWSLSVSGRPAHSSQIFQPEVGAGAVFETARILNVMREQLADKGLLTFNPGVMLGGTKVDYDSATSSGTAFGKTNVVAQTAQVVGGIRASSPQELSEAKELMQKIVADNLPHTSAELVFDEGYPPLAPSDGNRELLNRYSEISEALGYGPVVAVNPRNAGAADISFTAGHVAMALDGLGLMGSGGHTRDEVADISSLEKNAAKAALLMYRLSRPQ
ncbi:MAG: M20/M25/M40 family metallo-hydrolase [Gammaproteobacteria bacterium]|nr:M20/M25/M40 family metallo-hydrolase [Gammaproteobacteria bacterium]